MIFTSRIKRSKKGPFCSRHAFNSDFDYFTGLKWCLSWDSPHYRKMIIWSRNCPFVTFLRWNENGDPPFYLCFLLVMATQVVKRKKIWIVEVVDFEIWTTWDSTFRATEKYEIMLKLSISFHFSRSVNLKPFYWKILALTNKLVLGFSFRFFAIW